MHTSHCELARSVFIEAKKDHHFLLLVIQIGIGLIQLLPSNYVFIKAEFLRLAYCFTLKVLNF